MCNECREYPCNSRCPNNVVDERECCTECGYEFETGDSAYYALGRDDELYCLECIEEMTAEEIILNFLEEEEIW